MSKKFVQLQGFNKIALKEKCKRRYRENLQSEQKLKIGKQFIFIPFIVIWDVISNIARRLVYFKYSYC